MVEMKVEVEQKQNEAKAWAVATRLNNPPPPITMKAIRALQTSSILYCKLHLFWHMDTMTFWDVSERLRVVAGCLTGTPQRTQRTLAATGLIPILRTRRPI